jgi:hypothetical protein
MPTNDEKFAKRQKVSPKLGHEPMVPPRYTPATQGPLKCDPRLVIDHEGHHVEVFHVTYLPSAATKVSRH